jgi:hypothetical protein
MNFSVKDFAKSLFERFEEEGIPLLLAGGWAVTSYGFSRNTIDIDWVCSRSREEEVVALMRKLGFQAVSAGMASRFQYDSDLACPAVDLIWVNDESFAQMCGAIDPTLGVRVITYEGLITMKLYALKDDKLRKGKDLRDLQELLERNQGKIPEADLRAMCAKYACPEIFDKLYGHP